MTATRTDLAHLALMLAALGLTFLYLLAPLFFLVQATAISWALAGLVTLFVGLRLQSRTFLFTAFAMQLLGGALFLGIMEVGHIYCWKKGALDWAPKKDRHE